MKSLIIVLWSLLLILGGMGSAFGSTFTFTDSFEGTTLNPFWSVESPLSNAEYSLSSTQAKDGAQSLKLNSIGSGQRWIILGHQFDQIMHGTVSVWFYDIGYISGYPALGSMLSLNDSARPSTVDCFIGVSDWDGTYYHAFLTSNPSPNEGQTALARSAGWHEFKAIYESSGASLFIDGVLVRSTTENIGFDHLYIYLSGPGGDGAYYYDQFSVNVNPVPIPGAVVLLGSGLASLAFCRKRRAIVRKG